MQEFKLVSDYQPTGDQPKAIDQLYNGLQRGDKYQTLLGVTGSGKTFTAANLIEKINKPTLVFSHNKTLAAQLYSEFKSFFPHNAVEYFISYYDYYQPEAYIASTDTYIEKDTSINDEIDRLRLKATSALLTRKDVIIVASVSCIYGLGDPQEYRDQLYTIERGQFIDRNVILEHLVNIHYTRNDYEFDRGTFRVRGDVIEVMPAYEREAIRIEMFGNEIESMCRINPVTAEVLEELPVAAIFPAKHFVTSESKLKSAIEEIKIELDERLAFFKEKGKLLEAQRLEMRGRYDIEMLEELGYCSGVENYSRMLTGRKPGERPLTLLDYFPDDYLCFIDESHVTVPQIRGMYRGDRARKESLVEHGFRLPCALDNRPLRYEEFDELIPQTIYISATPSETELENCNGVIVEQVIRPTGLLDPEIEVRPVKTQIDDLIGEITGRVAEKQRILITTLTKRMSEDLTDYLAEMDIRVRYLHSEIDALDRVEILRDLRLGAFDVLVGINLLREGLDLPEVGLVAILDADKEGFLRSERSLLQIAGRAARNAEGKVIFYADKITRSMQAVIDETNRRRKLQQAYNQEHGLTPKTIYKSAEEVLQATRVADVRSEKYGDQSGDDPVEISDAQWSKMTPFEREEKIDMLERQMLSAAENMEFETAARIRDEVKRLRTNKKRGGKSGYTNN